ncbi:protein STRUBBELIG-RECEPTOR FAMILY 7-like [Magnolia sinica]|uniref:protein STRUBBELIG-RECEPTOR FAMILY 7-like n=1 Tax=Magnolia sinica TaxID=86752 RepID=UPI002659DDE4|nr:protein STRUBBELIG-RECEPTOR FAMILY 7-like [Magnolia sinica]
MWAVLERCNVLGFIGYRNVRIFILIVGMLSITLNTSFSDLGFIISKLSSLQLSGSMGYQLDSLTALTSFDMSNNNLGNSIPYQLPPNLQRLNLAGNSFNGGLPYSIFQMTSRKYLQVWHLFCLILL